MYQCSFEPDKSNTDKLRMSWKVNYRWRLTFKLDRFAHKAIGYGSHPDLSGIVCVTLEGTATNGLLEKGNVDGVFADFLWSILCLVGIGSFFDDANGKCAAWGTFNTDLEIFTGGTFGVDGKVGWLVDRNQLQTFAAGWYRTGIEYFNCERRSCNNTTRTG